ncbi:MAG: phosphatase PAP2 family protein [Nitrospirales bacterium]|nr:phosphatase PAP2 family protein [Nitrospirales bacterium]
MPYPLFSHLIEPSDKIHTTRRPFSTTTILLISALSILTILGALFPLFRLDYEVVLFLRSLHIQALDEIGRIGHNLGHGSTLILISVGLGLVGYIWNRLRFIRAGWQSLFAHAIAGLIIQIFKILLGRPRPQFMHQDHWQMGPTLQGGMNTFPSGHSAASFAVAAVLARHFPKGAWVWYGMAAFVAMSRIMKGAHFPSDALAGSLIGFLVGYIMARPLKDWLPSLLEALEKGLPYWVGGFALVWIIFHYPETNPLSVGMFWVGLTMIVVILGVRLLLILKPRQFTLGSHINIPTTNLMLGLGLALYTGSLLVALFALFTGMAWWIRYSQDDLTENPGPQLNSDLEKTVAQEAVMGLALIAILVGIQQIKGIIPLL